jgi:hypothetical protein|tara:strand:+ start:4804 stop:5181 length:378 start_codon:yes stop_codon:yes gene_type:complete
MYAAGFSLLGAQYTLADTVGFTITNMDGVPIKSALHGFIKDDAINERTQNIVSADFQGNSTYYDKVETFATGAAFVAWELVSLMTGTYIFYIMFLFGVPEIFVLVFVTLYVLLLGRAILGYMNRV